MKDNCKSCFAKEVEIESLRKQIELYKEAIAEAKRLWRELVNLLSRPE